MMAARDAFDKGLATQTTLPAPPPLQTVVPDVPRYSLTAKFLHRLREVALACLPTAQTAEDVRQLRQMSDNSGNASREEMQAWYDTLGRCETVVDFRLLPQIGILQEELLSALKRISAGGR